MTNDARVMTDARPPQPTLVHNERGLPHRLWLDWVVVFVAALALYVVTCAPDILMGDNGVPQLRVPAFPPTPAKAMRDNLVQVHPLYLGLAKVFTWLPVGNLAYRVTLASAWFGAMAVANIFVAVRVLTGSRWAALIGALSAALGHTFWQHCVLAEVLSLVAACLTAELLAFVLFARTGRVGCFLLAGLINGLSISNHLLGALAIPVYVVLIALWWVRGLVRGVHILGWMGFWLLGASIYLYVVLQAMLETGQVVLMIRSATTGTWPATNVGVSLSTLGRVVAYLLMEYPTLLILLAVPAIWMRPLQSGDRAIKWAVAGVAAVQFLFAARYPIMDQYTYFVPFYACMAILIGLGARVLIRQWPWTRWAGCGLAVLPVMVYVFLPSLVRQTGYNPFTRELAYRDPYKYFLTPWQQWNTGARRYAEEAFQILPKDAIFFADPTPAVALLYLQKIEGKRQDVTIVFAWDNLELEGLLKPSIPSFGPRWVRPVYTADIKPRYAPAAFIRDCKFVKEGVLYRVEPPQEWPAKPWK
jgi:hypothetical protein